jgi:AcrR family transcriptional regulator
MTTSDAKPRLYEAALDLMGRNGIEATSTRQILEVARIKNPSAISYHFGSKAGLVR